MNYRYSTFENSTSSLKPLMVYLEKNWFQIVIISLGIYVLFFKDVNVQFSMNAAPVTASQSLIVSPEGVRQGAVARPASLQGSGIRNVSQLNGRQDKKKKWDSRKAEDFPNLTFVLSPGYARRHNVHPDIVRQKVQTCKDYVKQFLPLAREESQKYGIPVSITLAQGLLESNAGDSQLARESNNHFGIKCRRKCRGCTCRNYSDDDIYDMFRVFNTVGESYREHSILLNSSRYKHLLKLSKSDYRGWAHGLKKAGYATDKRYAPKLIQIIEFLNLDQYEY